MSAVASPGEPQPYRVLARKYRPQTFAELIGQEALVRTLTNAIQQNRIAHAFVLTGVRGVGKTTTARILARAFNCLGSDGTGGPTIEPCGVCEPCVSIAADRNVDVLEMDAASRTGVDDIREIIDGVRYRPVAARYKIYIIDEVHMLTKNAFNALLKTLEEPPEHTKFIFATTEIRKVPVTVLSRCQRFDLRRVEATELASHFTRIAGKEGVLISPEAAQLIARAADGSVRDGLSLLDQAIALTAEIDQSAPIAPETVRAMLGLADRALVYDLFEAAMRGDMPAALKLYGEMHANGADALSVAQDLLELTHTITRLKVAADPADAFAAAETERVRGRELASKLSVPVLTRTWQILLKGVAEVAQAADGRAALDMVLIRLGFVADLPSPGELARIAAGAPPVAVSPPSSPASAPVSQPVAQMQQRSEIGSGGGATARQLAPEPQQAQAAVPQAETKPDPRSFEEVVALFAERREIMLRSHLATNCHLVHFEPGRLEIRPTERAPRDLANKVGDLLSSWTGERWVVSVAGAGGLPTLHEQAQAADRARHDWALAHPVIAAYLEAFPGAVVEAVRDHEIEAGQALPDAEPSDAEAGESTEQQLEEER
jgi:DNA polymerase-3 subunit gamma/tau